jgi:hypothetical protein
MPYFGIPLFFLGNIHSCFSQEDFCSWLTLQSAKPPTTFMLKAQLAPQVPIESGEIRQLVEIVLRIQFGRSAANVAKHMTVLVPENRAIGIRT